MKADEELWEKLRETLQKAMLTVLVIYLGGVLFGDCVSGGFVYLFDSKLQHVMHDDASVPCSNYASWPEKDVPARCFANFKGNDK